ncbi:MAG: BrnT family toxin [Anaerolineae bacterium]
MRIHQIIWIDKFVDKIESKHDVTTFEVEEVLRGNKKVRRTAKGDVEGEDVYLALGQTDAGRYLAVFFILKRNHDVLPISARDMDRKERRQYGRK